MKQLRELAWLAGVIVTAAVSVVAFVWITALFGKTVAQLIGAVVVVATLAAGTHISVDVRRHRAQ